MAADFDIKQERAQEARSQADFAFRRMRSWRNVDGVISAVLYFLAMRFILHRSVDAAGVSALGFYVGGLGAFALYAYIASVRLRKREAEAKTD